PQKNQHQRPNYYDYYSNTTDSDNTVYSSVNKKQRLVEKANAPLYYFNPSPADKNRIEQRRLAPGYRRKEEEAEKLFFRYHSDEG
ncbi:MAG: hypothetical protein LRY43_04545, partial [Gammaproteobacteria bacterium]|nr:hypothetical protein [Gammaproteobacteria bacterium]